MKQVPVIRQVNVNRQCLSCKQALKLGKGSKAWLYNMARRVYTGDQLGILPAPPRSTGNNVQYRPSVCHLRAAANLVSTHVQERRLYRGEEQLGDEPKS